jgi:hypothetical protein
MRFMAKEEKSRRSELLQERETNHCQCSQANSFNHRDVNAMLEGQLTRARMSLKRAPTDPLRRSFTRLGVR